MRRLAGIACAAAMLAAGCSSPAPALAGSRPGDPAGATAWAGPTSGRHLLLSDGRLYSEALDDDGGVCFWFTSATGTNVSLVWPAGYRVEDGPLRVLDAAGTEVARTFQEGLGFQGHYEAGRTGCAPGGLSRSFAVAAVEQIGVGSPEEAQ